MTNEYLEKLKELLIENDLSFDIVPKYEKYFELGKEANMTEEEIISRLPSVESIINELKSAVSTNYAENIINYSMRIKSGIIKKIVIKDSLEFGVKFEVSDNTNINILEDVDFLDISDKKNIVGAKEDKRVELTICIGPNIKFDEFKIKVSSCLIEVDKIVGTSAEIKVVSGNVSFGKIVFDSFYLNLVSGNTQIESIDANNLKISVVSGDIILVNTNNSIGKINTVSGDILIKNSYDTEKIKVSSITGKAKVISKKVNNKVHVIIEDLKNLF